MLSNASMSSMASVKSEVNLPGHCGHTGFLHEWPTGMLPVSTPLALLRESRLLERRHAIRARHRTLNGERPEPAQMLLRAFAGFVVLTALVDPGAEAGWAKLEGHFSFMLVAFHAWNCVMR
jgi:hypothetical protein